jgi:hypothetical protein
MVTHSKIVDPLYILQENMQCLIFKKYVSFKHFRKYIFNNVLTNRSFMDFLFHVPFFCTTADAVAELQTVCFVN